MGLGQGIGWSGSRWTLTSSTVDRCMEKTCEGDFGIQDPFLDGVSTRDKNQLICGFAEALRRNQYGSRKLTLLRARTVSAIIGSVCSSFRTNFRDDPGLDPAGRPLLPLKRQLSSYNTEDPAERPQKALPVRVFKALWVSHSCDLDKAIGQLTTGAFFFALRSCEYTKVTKPGKSKRLCVSDIQFFQHNKLKKLPPYPLPFETRKIARKWPQSHNTKEMYTAPSTRI